MSDNPDAYAPDDAFEEDSAEPRVVDAEYDEDEYDDDEDERPSDPVASIMVRGALMLLVIALVAGVSMIAYLMSIRGAPRSSAERLILLTETKVKEEPSKVDNWVDLAYAYMRAGRYSSALETIADGRKAKTKDKATSKFDLVEADTLAAAGRTDEALKMYDKGVASAKKDHEAKVKDFQERNIFVPVPNPVLVDMYIGRSEIYVERDKPKEALADLKAALENDKMNSYIMVKIGDLQVQLGQTAEAEKMYQESLRFVPGYQPALDGLSKIKKGK